MALLYSMISGRNPMVIMVVPKPSALCTQEPARMTIMTKRIVENIVVSSLIVQGSQSEPLRRVRVA